jgi:hypothetical protein
MSTLLLAFASTHTFAGVSSIVGTTVTGVRALALVNAVADTHAVECVSAVVGPNPSVAGVRALALVHAVAGTHAVECGSVVFGPILLLAPLHHDVAACSPCCCVSFPSSGGRLFPVWGNEKTLWVAGKMFLH